jgi:3,5-epimerase/4-reductase
MKILIYGSSGWIGTQLIELLNINNIEYIISKERLESNLLEEEVVNSKCTHVISTTGRTHGVYEGTHISTIDYLEKPGKLVDNMRDNYAGPMRLAEITKKHNIHYTYFGTGCIFSYDDKHTLENNVGFTEEDHPNFFGSSYSIMKGFTDTKMKEFKNVLNLRIRMPIVGQDNPRNFITKITNYEYICSIPNSMTILDILLPHVLMFMKKNITGTYNMTNPGKISHNEILTLYKKYVDSEFTWKNFSIEEQDKILLSKRSNNTLDTTKLKTLCHELNLYLPTIHDGIELLLRDYKH